MATGLSFSFLWAPVVHGQHSWVYPGDIWSTVRDAQFVSWGGFGAVYGDGAGLVALPGLPILLAPVAWLCGSLGLGFAFPYPVPHPTAWLVVGPVTFGLGTLPLFPLDSLARWVGLGRLRRGVLAVAATTALWPTAVLWGHPEDALAVAGILWALLQAFQRRWTRAGWLCGAAMCAQPLAALAFPVLAALALRDGGWRRAAAVSARAALFPVVLAALLFAGAPTATAKALLDQPNYPTVDWPTPWLAWAPRLGHSTVAAGPERLIAVVVSFAMGLWVYRGDTGPHRAMWAVGIALAARCLFESVMVPYYVMPAVVALVLAAALSSTGRLAWSLVAGTFLAVYSEWHYAPWPWYSEVVLLLGCLAWLGRPASSGANRAEIDEIEQSRDAYTPPSGLDVEVPIPDTPGTPGVPSRLTGAGTG